MRGKLSKEQTLDLLNYVGAQKIGPWKGDKISACCPIHHERNPSFGINLDYEPKNERGEPTGEHFQVFNCFSCGAKGTLTWLLYKSLPDKFKSFAEAELFYKTRYGVDVHYTFDTSGIRLKRYEEKYEAPPSSRLVLPMSDLAPFRSGKETFRYFFDRGFDKNDMREYMIGRDLENETVTIPAFWEDGTLAGIIGRYIDPSRPKNSRFMVYKFPKSSTLYPLDKLEVKDGVLLCVESMFDVMMMRKWGFKNVAAVMGDGLSRIQARMIASMCKRVIVLLDSDERGQEAAQRFRKELSGKVSVMTPSYLPERGKDPCEWGERETRRVVESASFVSGLPRM